MGSSIDDGLDRAAAVRRAVESAPESVNIDDVVDLLVHSDQQSRSIAFDAYRELIQIRPSVVDAAVARLGTHLQDSSAETRRRGALTAAVLVEHHPEQFDQMVPTLCSVGDDLADPGREAAVLTLAKLALERPEQALSAVDTLVKMCLDRVTPIEPAPDRGLPDVGIDHKGPESHAQERRDDVRIHAIAGLTKIASVEPDSVQESLPAVIDLLEDDNHLVRAGACEILEAVATTYPGDVASFASNLATRVASDTTQPVPWRAADALVALSAEHSDCVGEAVAPIVDDLSKFLESNDAERRRVGVTLLAAVAQVDEDAVQPLKSTLIAFLEDADASVRTQTVVTLGRLGDRDATAALTNCAETDPDEEVREAAATALEQHRTPPETDG